MHIKISPLSLSQPSVCNGSSLMCLVAPPLLFHLPPVKRLQENHMLLSPILSYRTWKDVMPLLFHFLCLHPCSTFGFVANESPIA